MLGFSSLDEIVGLIIGSNLAVFTMSLLLTGRAMQTSKTLGILRLHSSGQVPEMAIDAGLEWHAFFSYVWNTGQDQCQLIKQQLLLLLPEARLFLDLDDLDDLSMIEQHVADSQCVLLFLSRGFFHSNHCLREVRHTASAVRTHTRRGDAASRSRSPLAA